MPPCDSAQKIESGDAANLASILHDCFNAGIVILGAHEQILGCTPEAERLLGLPSGKTVGVDLSALPIPLQKIAREAAATQKPVSSRVINLGAGEDAPVLRVGAFPFRTEGGKTQIIVTVNDVAIVQHIERNLLRLDRLASVGTLSAGMAHEIRNALVASKTFVDLLLDKNQDDELASLVRREMLRIDSIVSQMLRFGAPTQPVSTMVRLHEVLNHSLRLVQHLFEDKLISLHRKFAAAHDTIAGDDYQLEQAFLNLFLNALEAMEPGGALTVATELVAGATTVPAWNGQLRVTVADNGLGIDPANLSRLFEPFFSTKPNGTGLGLAITRRIVHEHHGEITVQSQPNRGTTFQILLPANGRSI